MQTSMAPMRRNRRPVPGSASFDRTNPFIYLGTLRNRKKIRARPGALVAPVDIDHELLQWPVQDLVVLLVGDPDYSDETARLAGILLRDGALRVVVVDGTYTPARIHRAIAPTVTPRATASVTLPPSEPNFD